jgi:hypothetical protein
MRKDVQMDGERHEEAIIVFQFSEVPRNPASVNAYATYLNILGV